MNSKKLAWAVLAGIFFLAMVGIGIFIGRITEPNTTWSVLGYALTSLLFGVLVGLSEILSRYRDEPIQASTTGSGLIYLLLNGVISLGAFALLCKYNIFPAIQHDLLLIAIVGGFGGMTVFRSKLFTFRSPDGTEHAIGPAIVLEAILKTIDQKIDRRRATERQAKVYAEMGNLSDFENTTKYIRASLPSFQNLTEEDKREIEAVIKDYQDIDWPDSLKCLGLGFAYLNIAGEENFDQVVANLKKFLESIGSRGPANVGAPPPPRNTTGYFQQRDL